MAPIRPANITAKVTTLMSTRPAPTVLATAVPNVKAATKLKNAAQMTAFPGVRTRVETTVAIEGCVVETVDVIEDQGDNDERRDRQQVGVHPIRRA